MPSLGFRYRGHGASTKATACYEVSDRRLPFAGLRCKSACAQLTASERTLQCAEVCGVWDQTGGGHMLGVNASGEGMASVRRKDEAYGISRHASIRTYGFMGAFHWEVRQEVKQHRAGALMLLQRVPHAVRSPFQEARLCCLASVFGRKATFLMGWKCHLTIAWEDSDRYHQAFPVKLSVVTRVDLHEIRPLRRPARSQWFSRISLCARGKAASGCFDHAHRIAGR